VSRVVDEVRRFTERALMAEEDPLRERRVRELANRMEDVVHVERVEAPPAGERLPDRDWHDRYRKCRVHPYDKTSELFWIRGELAEFLGVREEVPADV